MGTQLRLAALPCLLLLACSDGESPPPPDPCECGGRVCGKLCGKVCGVCPDDGVCSADQLSCRPALPVGAPCRDDLQCGTGRICLRETALVPGGYCSRRCAAEDPCPDGSPCLPGPGGESVCQAACSEGEPGACRLDAGYRCAAGVCPPCVGRCDGRSCGDDGCGGACGVVLEGVPACDLPGDVCAAGKCDAGFERLGALPKARWDMKAFDVSGLVLLVGGREVVRDPDMAQHSRGVARVEKYNPQTRELTLHSTLPEPLARPHAALLGSTLYVAGGTVDPDLKEDPEAAATKFYRQEGISWRTLQTAGLPAPSRGGALEAVGGRLYLVVGETAEGVSDAVHEYDPEQDRWSAAPSRPTARTLAASVSDGSRLWLLGGWNGREAVRTVEVFDPTSGWSAAPDLAVGVAGATAVIADGRIFVFGGWEGPERGDIRPWVQAVDLATRRPSLLGTTWNSLLSQTPVRTRDGAVLLFGATETLSGAPIPHDEVLRFLVPAR